MKKDLSKLIFFILLFSVFISFAPTGSLLAQNRTIVIIKDNESPFLQQLEDNIKTEIKNVLNARFSLKFIGYSGEDSIALIKKQFNSVYNNNDAALVIAVGIKSSNILHSLKTYPIPSVATMVITDQLPKNSGISNYTYDVPFQSTIEIASFFSKMYELETIGIPTNGTLSTENLNKLVSDSVSIITFDANSTTIPANVDGVLILPLVFNVNKEAEVFIEQLNNQGIPSLSILKKYLKYDCTAAIESNNILVPLVKKTALNALYILEGTNASEIALQQSAQKMEVILNMKGVKRIKKLPNWSYLERAQLVNVVDANGVNTLSLSESIVLGLNEKLTIKKSVLAVDKADQNVKQAKGNLTPTIDGKVQSIWLSDNLIDAMMGREGKTTITGSLNLQQVIFSEPILTNIAVNKLVHESTKAQNRQTVLNDVVSITQAYISVLYAKTNLTVQNENLNVTKTNLSIAETKDKLGVSKQSDVSRWVSELNVNKIQLSEALANYKKSVYTLNEVLNQEIASEYNFPEHINIKEVLHFPEEIIMPYIKNEFLTDVLVDFYISEMQTNSPELLQVSLSEQIIDRQIKSNKRQFVLPQIVGFASASDVFLREGNYTNPSLPVPALPNDLTWNAGVSLSLPIYDRRSRTTNLQKSKIDQENILYTRQEVENNLERSIRSQVQQFKASYVSNSFALIASKAADQNFSGVEDAYKQGFITVTQLLEAQNAKFNANLLAVQTNYKMVLDYLILERLTGKIQILESDIEQKEYLDRLQQYLILGE